MKLKEKAWKNSRRSLKERRKKKKKKKESNFDWRCCGQSLLKGGRWNGRENLGGGLLEASIRGCGWKSLENLHQKLQRALQALPLRAACNPTACGRKRRETTWELSSWRKRIPRTQNPKWKGPRFSKTPRIPKSQQIGEGSLRDRRAKTRRVVNGSPSALVQS